MYRQRFHDRKPKDNFDEVADMARSAYRIGQEIKDTINTEHKQFVVAQTSTSVTSSGSILATVQSMAQGDDSNQRVGDSIKCQNLTLRWTGEVSSASNVARLRLIIFWDEANVITSVAQFLQYVGSFQSVISGKVYDNRFLSKVLYDKTMTINKQITSASGYFPIREKIIKINKHTQFDTSTTTVVTGALKMLAISDNVSASVVNITFNALLSYTDD